MFFTKSPLCSDTSHLMDKQANHKKPRRVRPATYPGLMSALSLSGQDHQRHRYKHKDEYEDRQKCQTAPPAIPAGVIWSMGSA